MCGYPHYARDIEAALKISDKIAIFYAGTILEIANTKDFSGEGEKLRHQYTKALWNALPQNKFQSIKGHQPMQDEVPEGCFFYERCTTRGEVCSNAFPS
ncbi:MAG: hypothetical protein R2741_00675 [Methanolobus sp.]